MPLVPSRITAQRWPLLLSAIAVSLLMSVATRPAGAIPVFARKYETSCITCHAGFPKLNAVGAAFRRNGYQFPMDDFDKVKDEPIPLGTDAWTELWPDSIWPNDIPHLPPVALRSQMTYAASLTDLPVGRAENEFRVPADFKLLSGGTLGEDISWFVSYSLGQNFTFMNRMFVQFDNLFAWDPEEDDDGMHLANRWLALPMYAMNLRVGQFDPGVVAPWASINRMWGIQGRLPNLARVGANRKTLEPFDIGLELNGVVFSNWSYALGLINGNRHDTENNNSKDFYYRVARRWWGYPMDGVVVSLEPEDDGGDEEMQFDVSMREGPGPRLQRLPGNYVFRGQDDGADLSGSSSGLDFWRDTSFETGTFGYFGRGEVTASGVARLDRFQRVGADARWTRRNLDVFGVASWGWDDEVGDATPGVEEQHFSWFLEADYFFKPWWTGYARYEELLLDSAARDDSSGIRRGVIGTVFTIRANMRAVLEVVGDAKGRSAAGSKTTSDSFNAMLDFAY